MSGYDVGLCADCMEVTDGHSYHAGCCGHIGMIDPMTTEDGTTEISGEGWCADCGSGIVLSPPDEDGRSYWEVMA